MASAAPITFFFIRPSAKPMYVSTCRAGMCSINVLSSGNSRSSPGTLERMINCFASIAAAMAAAARSPSTFIASLAKLIARGLITGRYPASRRRRNKWMLTCLTVPV